MDFFISLIHEKSKKGTEFYCYSSSAENVYWVSCGYQPMNRQIEIKLGDLNGTFLISTPDWTFFLALSSIFRLP